MKYLYLFDESGRCYMRLEPPATADMAEVAQRNGASEFSLSSDSIEVHHACLADGVVTAVVPPPRVQSYQERRYADYPPLADQLDALWHAMADGVLPVAPQFFNPIAAVKAAHPKENS